MDDKKTGMNQPAPSLWESNLVHAMRTAFRLSSHPDSRKILGAIMRNQAATAALRHRLQKEGVTVPAILIISATTACNLRCSGCYAGVCSSGIRKEMPLESLDRIIGEARELGVSLIMIAGGEPFLRPGLLETAARHRALPVVVFTNGTMVSERMELLSAHRNLLPVVSLEGSAEETDRRRGAGVYRQVTETMQSMRESDLLFGVSLTATAGNIDSVTDPGYAVKLRELGARMVFYVEYVPADPDAPQEPLSAEQKATLSRRFLKLSRQTGMLCVAFPGDETPYGGCLASGRGFVHINAAGGLEPCPFAPFSDRNAVTDGLLEALRSPLLAEVRKNHHMLEEGKGGCALWSNREWLAALAGNTGCCGKSGD
ncbi:MAG: radical SAM protein [Clostridiales bacterium]|nr:radical SAM protein [Clostridiales bacterium]